MSSAESLFPLIYLSALASKTRPVFELLAKRPELSDFVLVGGTAIALQAKHRLSEDLDFWLPEGPLPKFKIDQLIRELKDLGHRCEFTTAPHLISQMRINHAQDLRLIAQDWSINDVKVQFFAPLDRTFQHFRQFKSLPQDQTVTTFSVMSLEGLFAMKAYVLHQRIRSRDLFDLWHFVQKGKSIADILEEGQRASPMTSPDHAKAVLRGSIPLDEDDEGFEAIDVNITIETIFQEFMTLISDYEIELARRRYLDQ